MSDKVNDTVNSLLELKLAAKAHLLAKAKFDHVFSGYWVNDVKPCDDETGYRLLDQFRKEVEVFYFDYKRKDVGDLPSLLIDGFLAQ